MTMPEIKIEIRENTDVDELCAAVEAAAPGEGLWWTAIEHYVVPGRPLPQIGLIQELRRLKRSEQGEQT